MNILIYFLAIVSISKQIWAALEPDRGNTLPAKPINKLTFWQYSYFLSVISSKFEEVEYADMLAKAGKCLELTDIETSLDSLNLILLALWFSPRDRVEYLASVRQLDDDARTLDADVFNKMNKFVTLAANMERTEYDVQMKVELWKSYFKHFTPLIVDPVPLLPSFITRPVPALIDEQKAAIACYETIIEVQTNRQLFKSYYEGVDMIRKRIYGPRRVTKKVFDEEVQKVVKSIRATDIKHTPEGVEMANFMADLEKRTEIERTTTQNGWIKSLGIMTVGITAALIVAKTLLNVLRGC